MKKKSVLNPDQVLDQMRKYCAYQERCHMDVRYKLVKIGVRGEILEKIIGQLVEEKFLDEERFARSYTRSKFRQNQWGRQKITLELKRKKIGSFLQKKAMEEIDPEEYSESLTNLLKKKISSLMKYSEDEQKIRLFRFAYQRGFEADLIYKVIDRLYSQ